MISSLIHAGMPGMGVLGSKGGMTPQPFEHTLVTGAKTTNPMAT